MQAVEHYRLALEADPVDVNPSAYAETQYHIAVTMLDIAQKSGRQEDLDAARAAANASHEVYLAAGQHQYDRYFDNIETGIQLIVALLGIKLKQNGLAAQGQRNQNRKK